MVLAVAATTFIDVVYYAFKIVLDRGPLSPTGRRKLRPIDWTARAGTVPTSRAEPEALEPTPAGNSAAVAPS